MHWTRATAMSGWTQAFLLAAVGVASGFADTRALIEQALDERANITLDNVALRDAIRVLSEKTGVKFAMSPEAMALTPNGPDTVFQRVHIPNIPLRKGLSDLFAPLGMTFVVRDDCVEIIAKPALRTLGRPPTWSEVDTLSFLAGLQPGLDPKSLAELEPRVQFQVPGVTPWLRLSEAIRKVGAGSGDEVLTVACEHLDWAWYPSDRLVVVTTRQQRIREQLKRPISLKLTGRPLPEVIQSVGRCADVDVRIEPGAVASLPRHVQQGFSINVPRQPAEDVLDQIAAATGLGYLIESDGVLFYRGGEPVSVRPASSSPGGGSGPSDPYIAKLVVPLSDGRTVEWLIRQSELPDDLREMRSRDVAAMIEALRAKVSAEKP